MSVGSQKHGSRNKGKETCVYDRKGRSQSKNPQRNDMVGWEMKHLRDRGVQGNKRKGEDKMEQKETERKEGWKERL